MSGFEENLNTLKRYKDLERKDIFHLISLNDYNLEYEKVDQETLREYLKVRRAALQGSVHVHVEALRRKEALRSIREDAQRLITVNKYITHLIEEKKEPVDTLLSNLEYSGIFLEEGCNDLESLRRRKRRCSFLKKIFLLVILLLLTFKLASFIL